MTTTTLLPPSTIEVHPDYPFVRIGLAFDFNPKLYDMDPAEHVVKPSDWNMEIAGMQQGYTFYSREEALTHVESLLFAEWQGPELVPQLIQAATEAGNWALALRLAEGKGRAQGEREAKIQFAEALAKADRVLAPYRMLSGGR